MNSLYIENRKKFAAEMENNSLFIAFNGRAPGKRGDQYYPYSPHRNFYYLTGIDRENIILTIHKNGKGEVKETLYLERFDEVAAKWVGAVMGKDEAKEVSGVENFSLVENFRKSVTGILFGHEKYKVYMDLENRRFDENAGPETIFARDIKESYPYVEMINAYAVFARLRAIKTDEEVARIKKAIEITREGIYMMMAHAKPGMFEYELEAYFDYRLKSRGVRDKAFDTILAAGKNAAVLHYVDNNTKTRDGDLVLCDLGAAHGYYSADITRTFPVSGKFTERQKLLYNIVLEANRKVIEKIKPGVPFKELNETVISHYAEELARIGLIKEKEEISKYYYHGVSHMLGLETHDIGRGGEGALKAGMVLTVEPGLYILEEETGIRIEDNVLVTEDGCIVLSKDIIRTVEEIEEFMKNPPKDAFLG